MKQTFLFLSLAMIAISSFYSCSKDSCEFKNTNLVGSWKLDKATDSLGKDYTDSLDDCNLTNRLEFTLDSMKNTVCDGAYKYTTLVKDNKNYLTFGTESIEVTDYSCNSMIIKLNESNFNKTISYQFTK
jgi:hypothetical protein